ncbi:PPE family protein, partial [Mycobacterium asiaticum]|uniref:PPE family protein n=1 Tax=Mycobacterium asiaticum TaxID=1790 RepID=UPI000AE53B9F
MSFLMLPPEITSALMFSGAGSGPMLEAAAAWQSLASELDSAAESFSALTSELTAQAWQGPAAQAMAAAATPYANYLATAAAQAAGTSSQAQAVAGAFEAALAATVHPALISANRSNMVSLVMTNLFGQNAPAIAAIESIYEEMWAADVAAMLGYHGGAAAAVAQLVSPAAAALPSFGYGNVGEGNIGFFNTGTLNFGINNTSPFFTPTDPITTFGGFGIGNNGTDLVGAFNAGSRNVGIANNGFMNIGIGNVGANNSGLPLSFLSALGVGNQGNFNQGFFNIGNHNLGIGLVGDNLIGVGPLHIDRALLPTFPSLPSLGSVLPAASTFPSFGYGNVGEGNIGFFNTG